MLLLWARGCGQRHHTHAHSFILVFVHYYWSCRFYYNSICHCFHIWRTFRVAFVTIWNVHPKTSMCVQVQLIIFCFGICLDTPLACLLSVSAIQWYNRTGCVTLSKEWQPPWLETSTAEPTVEFSVGKGPQRLEFLSAGGFYDVMTNPSCTLNYILFKPLSLFKMS